MRNARWLPFACLSAALVSRMVALNAVPLAPDEAVRAWASWTAVHGGLWSESGAPLLTNGNALLFLLFGAGDGIARLLPALAGALLVGLPWLWRDRIGWKGAMVASALLLFSPTALAAARRLEGTAPAALALALLATALWTERSKPTALVAVGWALGLTAGPRFWDGLLALALASLFAAPPSRPRRASLLRGLLYGSIAAWLLSIAFGLHPEGWAGPMAGLAAWLHSWGGATAEGTMVSLLALLVSEPLTLLLAFYALRQGESTPHRRWLACWTVWMPVVLLLHGAGPRATLLVLVPLALLAGEGAATLWEARNVSLPWPGPLVQEVAYAVLGLFALLLLARYTTYEATGEEPWLALVVGMLGGLLYVGFLLSSGQGFATRALVRGVGMLLLIAQAGTATSLLAVRAADPAEPLSQPAASPDVRSAAIFAEDYSRLYAITPERLEIALVGRGESLASLRWTLRDFPAAYASPVLPAEPPDLLITPPDLTPQGGDWDGLRFFSTQTTALHFADGPAFIRWLFYRTPPAPVERQGWILWWHEPGE